jgi:hypothetical protein
MKELVPTILKIVYTTLGVLDGRCQKILFDSITGSMELTKISASSTMAGYTGWKSKNHIQSIPVPIPNLLN